MKLNRWAAVLFLCASGSASAECMLGEITTFAGNFVPRGYAPTNGQLLPIAQNQGLFSIIGTTYGGDGSTTFALPNIQGGLTHQPGGVALQTLICISGTFPSRG